MRRHIIFFTLIAAGLYFVNTYDSVLNKLMKPMPITAAEGAGIQDVEFDTKRYEPISELVEGAFTVLYFYSDSCPGCRRLNSDLKRFVQVRPDVAIRRFDLGFKWSSDYAYNTYRLRIAKTPFILIYGPDGSLITEDVGLGDDGHNLLYDWMNEEWQQDWDRQRDAKKLESSEG